MFSERKYLDKLNSLIDVDHVNAAQKLQEDSWNYNKIKRLPILVSCHDKVKHIINDTPPDWPVFRYSEVIADPGKMLIDELTLAYEGALLRDDRMFTVRANYGLAIIPALFGCKAVIEGTSSWIKPLGLNKVKLISKNGIPDFSRGLGAKVIETEQYFLEKLKEYENLEKTVHISVCDTEGPFNLAGEILGSRIYTDVYDNPTLVHELLSLVTKTYVDFTKLQKELIGEEMDSGYYWQYRLQGGTRVVDDLGVNLSAEMYEEFCKPYNEEAFKPFGGGFLHYCGQGNQIFDIALRTQGVRAINFGNPELQDLHKLYKRASKKTVCLLWDGEFKNNDRNIIKTGIICKQIVKSWKEARELMETREE